MERHESTCVYGYPAAVRRPVDGEYDSKRACGLWVESHSEHACRWKEGGREGAISVEHARTHARTVHWDTKVF